VVDGIPNGHAWPLHARLDLVSSAGTVTSFSDPVTGAFQLALNASQAYTLAVTPEMPGYAAQTVQIPAGGGVPAKINILAAPGACPAGYTLQAGACNLVAGGLVVGLVKDQNTALGVNGANIAAGTNSTLSFASGDPAQGNGFYTLFAGSGAVSLNTSLSGYTTQKKSISLASNSSVVRQDFSLPAGRLASAQSQVLIQLPLAKTGNVPITLTNSGSAALNYTVALTPTPSSWVSASALSGKLAVGVTQTVNLSFNSTGLSAGQHAATLSISTDTPYGSLNLPVNLVVGGVAFLPIIDK
jgi:hypothetical protein